MSQRANSASLFFVGARFVCTKCRTRGVTSKCGCGAKTAPIDILAPTNARFLGELTSPPKSDGAPTREEIFWGGLRSRSQWVLSGVVALAVGLSVASNETAWGWQKVGYAIAEVLLLTLLFRLPILAVELLFRLFVAVIELGLAAGCFIAGSVGGSPRLVAAAKNWLARAERVLSGEYFWRRSMVSLRTPPYLDGEKQEGALPPSQALRVLVTTGKHGALELCDGELPPFRVVLSSGETVSVVLDAGVISFRDPRLDESVEKPVSPLFQETRQIDLSGAERVTLSGGEWSEDRDVSGYREQLAPRNLRGTPLRPLHLEVAEWGAGVWSDEAPALTPGRPPRSSL